MNAAEEIVRIADVLDDIGKSGDIELCGREPHRFYIALLDDGTPEPSIRDRGSVFGDFDTFDLKSAFLRCQQKISAVTADFEQRAGFATSDFEELVDIHFCGSALLANDFGFRNSFTRTESVSGGVDGFENFGSGLRMEKFDRAVAAPQDAIAFQGTPREWIGAAADRADG